MEDIKTFLISDIKEITVDKIIYIDNQVEKEIILKECAENYANEFNSNIHNYVVCNGDILDKNILAKLGDDLNSLENDPSIKQAEPLKIEENRCIGQRDWFAKNPYFVFFSNPKFRFEIVTEKRFLDCFNKNWHQRYYPEFVKIQLQLQQFNWYTFDLG
ncbi:MAG: hypothetical protein ACI4WH_00680 [Oscillospiraceae bacterium]